MLIGNHIFALSIILANFRNQNCIKMKFVFVFVFCFNVTFTFAQQQFSVYFDSNKSGLTISEAVKLKSWTESHPDIKVVAINGYTDEDGTSGFNDTLAQKRVSQVYALIKDKVKIRDDFKTRSFGENFIQSKSKAENRKVSVYYLESKDLAREDEILGIKKELPVVKEKPLVYYPDKMVFENPDGTKSEFKLDVAFMKRIADAAVGEKIKIENLNFVINT